jgi:coenzyme F420-reducing hydrogenase delta subunit
MRMEYPSNVKIIRVPCTGKVDALYLLKALENGVDGVYVAGCMEGDCHFLKGNIRARKRVEYVKELLEGIGINPERVAMYNLSAAQGPRFVEIAREMTEKIKALGPNPVKTGAGSEMAKVGTDDADNESKGSKQSRESKEPKHAA